MTKVLLYYISNSPRRFAPLYKWMLRLSTAGTCHAVSVRRTAALPSLCPAAAPPRYLLLFGPATIRILNSNSARPSCVSSHSAAGPDLPATIRYSTIRAPHYSVGGFTRGETAATVNSTNIAFIKKVKTMIFSEIFDLAAVKPSSGPPPKSQKITCKSTGS